MRTDARRLVALVRPERRRAVLGVLLQVLTVGAGLGLMGTSAWLISKAALHPSIAVLGVAVVGVRFFGISRGLLRYLERLVSHDVTLRLLSTLRVRVYGSLAPLAPARLQDLRGGDLVGRVIEDVDTLQDLFVRVLGPSLAAALVAALVAALLVPMGHGGAASALVGLAVAGALVPGMTTRLGRAPGRRRVAARGDLSAGLSEAVSGVGEIVSFGAQERYAGDMEDLGLAMSADEDRQVRVSALGGALVSFVADATVVAVLALSIPRVRSGSLDGTELAVVALVTLAAFEAVAPLAGAWQGLGACGAAARRLFDLLDGPPEVRDPSSRESGGDAKQRSGREAPLFEARDLTFTYPGAPRPALRHVTFRLETHRKVAVVGPSGSGKSTLAHLLLRFWEVPEGTLHHAGRDVRAQKADGVRAAIRFAGQRTHLFTGTIRDNLHMARPGAEETELARVLHLAALDGLVARLPAGLETWIGEQGLRLSGGERQRLALARALLRPGPLLLLDEPTSHLDAVTEGTVLERILGAEEGRTVLWITHRLTGLEPFDEVLVLDRGGVVERGRATALASAGGLFQRMLTLQRASLTDDAFDDPDLAP